MPPRDTASLHSTGQQATATIPERPTRPKIRLRHQPQPPRHHLGRRRGSVRRCTPSRRKSITRPRRGKRHRHGPWLPSAAPRRAQDPAGHAASRGQCGGRPGVQRRIQHAFWRARAELLDSAARFLVLPIQPVSREYYVYIEVEKAAGRRSERGQAGEAQPRPSLLPSELLRTSEPPSALLSSRAGDSQAEVQHYI